MGHMDVLGIIANGFNIYFPMLMVRKNSFKRFLKVKF